ncbi:MAG: hypothetical protein Phog2KO_32980 [Phototrophicaceae bacterium]
MYSVYPHKDDKHILVIELSGILTVQDLKDLNIEVANDYLEKMTDKVGLLYLLEDVKKYPQDIKRISDASKPISTSDKVVLQVFLGNESPIFKFLVNVVAGLFGEKLYRAKNMDDALNKFAEEWSKSKN